jgi:hypothetical protein
MRKLDIVIIGLIIVVTAFFLVFISGPHSVRSAIEEVSGLAVAQTPLQWNNLQDAAAGQTLSSGIAAVAPYLWNGTNYVASLGTATNGMNVNIAAASSNLGVYTTTSSTIVTGQVTVDTTGTVQIVASGARKSVIIRNIGSVNVYIGVSGVSSTTGMLLQPLEILTLDRDTAAVYGAAASSTCTLAYLQE